MRTVRNYLVTAALLVAVSAVPVAAAQVSDAHAEKAQAAIDKAIKYLRSTQNDDGSWTPKPGPAITGLVTAAMLRSPDIDRNDPAMNKAIKYILGFQKEDGGIYDAYLKNYNTSICLMALARVGDDPEIQRVIEKTYDFFRALQWDATKKDPRGNNVTRKHPYFGGAGYGDSKHGRPDGSNTFMMLSALYDSGFDCKDPMYQNAVVYVSRLQGVPQNDLFADKIQPDGGFIYATSINKEHIGEPQTRTDDANITEKQIKGEYDGKLPTYGSMTYAGYMSYLYAQLDRQDPRVTAARSWISENYATDTHPRMGEKSYYYYMHFFARALAANGEKVITDGKGEKHNWAEDVIDSLVKRQREDGSWSNEVDRWMEGDPNLATAYALIALQVALGR
jgi:squalene-hopene/tetraprenyl-beta-curcumene cyclase